MQNDTITFDNLTIDNSAVNLSIDFINRVISFRVKCIGPIVCILCVCVWW